MRSSCVTAMTAASSRGGGAWRPDARGRRHMRRGNVSSRIFLRNGETFRSCLDRTIGTRFAGPAASRQTGAKIIHPEVGQLLDPGQPDHSSEGRDNASFRVRMSEVRACVRGADTCRRGLPGCPLSGVQSVGCRAASVRFHGALGGRRRFRLRLKRFLMPVDGRRSLRCRRPRPPHGKP